MVKELMHIFRTYFITFRYIKKNELSFFWLLTYSFLIISLLIIFSNLI